MESQPNILLLVTDQHRADCLGVAGHPVLQTPHLDHIAGTGYHFRNAYSACPICIPARRTLMSGTKPSTHGVFGNYNAPLELPTLPGVLSAAGYQTHLTGKLHLHPKRKLYGFDSTDWADGPSHHELDRIENDYQRFLLENGVLDYAAGEAHGLHYNGWVARPFHLDERLHFSNWCTDRALRFLDRRDPSQPFFLNVSYFAPHEPCTPPAYYFDKYMQMELPEPSVADWAKSDVRRRGNKIPAWRINPDPIVMKQLMAGYFGSIEHIDHQIGRLLRQIPDNTIIMFVSDHGEMLGDHHWIRKRNAYEGSAHIPFLVNLPNSKNQTISRTIDNPVELMDVMPTLLDLAGVDIPETIDGQTTVPLMQGEPTAWRDYVHGECCQLDTQETGMQFITDGKTKYIYYPGTGAEQLFDLTNDPREMIDMSAFENQAQLKSELRNILINELNGRPEGFVQNGDLAVLGGATSACLPALR